MTRGVTPGIYLISSCLYCLLSSLMKDLTIGRRFNFQPEHVSNIARSAIGWTTTSPDAKGAVSSFNVVLADVAASSRTKNNDMPSVVIPSPKSVVYSFTVHDNFRLVTVS
eukprot:CAMPEP_0184656240 /NCGR_PEP_ID=MMETSP0308-20130426/16074_1 /TAXON_ID=38269 /ORGANISM="Gloeochaete witrockiana, Strain SAG 46.84" /LENGTH=109 /DNA_ID=CAMNT_0027093261 /DNA_START=365 /DNA_END=690 /DNA_ORIENTATION=-